MIIYCSSNLLSTINNDIQENIVLTNTFQIMVYILFGTTLLTFLFLLFYFNISDIELPKFITNRPKTVAIVTIIVGVLNFLFLITVMILRIIIYNQQQSCFDNIDILQQMDANPKNTLISQIQTYINKLQVFYDKIANL